MLGTAALSACNEGVDNTKPECVLMTEANVSSQGENSRETSSLCSDADMGVVAFDDVGNFFKDPNMEFSDSAKLRLIKEQFVPGESYKFPKVFMNGHNRSFSVNRLKT
jgi:hypothetical protein